MSTPLPPPEEPIEPLTPDYIEPPPQPPIVPPPQPPATTEPIPPAPPDSSLPPPTPPPIETPPIPEPEPKDTRAQTPTDATRLFADPRIPPTALPLSDAQQIIVKDLPTLPRTRDTSGAIFGWCVTQASYDLEPKVVKAQFGDGYAQRRPAGLNTQAHMWSISMRNIDADTAKQVTDFLAARNGVDIFNWTPPRTDVPESVICPSWSFVYGDMMQNGSLLYTVSFKFEEVFL